MMTLPDGATQVSSTEWQVPCPWCAEPRAFINPYRGMGHCKRAACGWSRTNKKGIYEDYGMPADEDAWEGALLHEAPHKERSGFAITSGLRDPYNYPRPKEFLRNRGITHAQITRSGIQYAPKTNQLVAKVLCYSTDLPPEQLVRYPSDKCKWIPQHKGIDLNDYCFGLDRIKADNKGLILVEGIFDMVVTDLIGYAVALCGTNKLTKSALLRLSKWKRILIWTDPDDAGEKFRNTATRSLESIGCQVRHLRLDDPKKYRPRTRENHAKIMDALRRFAETGQVRLGYVEALNLRKTY